MKPMQNIMSCAHINGQNNNCESLNNQLKLAIQWKPLPLMDLIDKIQELVCVQYKTMELS